MSGDPSRGAISLEMDEPLLTGQKVQVGSQGCSPHCVRLILLVVYA